MNTKEAIIAKGKSWWRYTKIAFMAILGLTIVVFLYLIFANYSDGTRTGYVTKISRKGYIFKTYEGEMNFGFFGGSATAGKPSETVWYFSVTNSKIAKEVEEASKSGHKVTLHYKQKYIKISLRGETEYLVYKVEDTIDSAPPPAAPPAN